MGGHYGRYSQASPSEERRNEMPDPSRSLRRSKNRLIAGVCGGIAERFGWDPTLVRTLYVVVSIVSVAFPGILVYILLWIIMPGPDS
jgi:phage shock protein PspC (stress-responsive transcriptional regulator)